MTENREKLSRIIITICTLSVYLVFLILNLMRDDIVDDAFITYRYVRNFVGGHGLVYNPGEFVLGTTSPGYALLLSIGAFFTNPEFIPIISLSVNFISTLGLMFCLSILAYKFSDKNYMIALFAPTLVFGSPGFLLVIATGMEVPVFVALVAVSLVLIVYRKWLLGSLILGLTIWLRPEGAFLIALFGITLFSMAIAKSIKWKSFFSYSIALTLPGMGYLLMLLSVYNTILPHSILAKSSGLYAYERFSQMGSVLLHIASPFILFLNTFYTASTPELANIIFLFILTPLAIFFIVIGSIELIKLDRVLWILPVYLLIAIIFYSSRSTRLFVWYHSNYHILLLSLVALGMGKIAYSALEMINRASLTHIAISILLFVSLPAMVSVPVFSYIQEPHQAHKVATRAVDYYELLQEIGDDIPQDAVIALPETGYLGFYLPNNKILDLAGLNSPEIVDYFPVSLEERDNDPTNSAIPKEAILDFQPDIIITFDWFAIYGLYRADWFDELYEVVYSVPNIDDPDFNVDVIVRRDRLDDIIISPEDENTESE